MRQLKRYSFLLSAVLCGAIHAQAAADTANPVTQPSTGDTAAVVASTDKKGSSAMTDTQKLAIAKEMLDAWTGLDWERVYELHGKDGALHNMMLDPIVGE